MKNKEKQLLLTTTLRRYWTHPVYSLRFSLCKPKITMGANLISVTARTHTNWEDWLILTVPVVFSWSSLNLLRHLTANLSSGLISGSAWKMKLGHGIY